MRKPIMNKIKMLLFRFSMIVPTAYFAFLSNTKTVLAKEYDAPKTVDPPSDFNKLFGNSQEAMPPIPDDPNINHTGDMFESAPSEVGSSGTYQSIMHILNSIIHVVTALILIWLLISFVIFAAQLSQHGDNPQLRHTVVHNMYRNMIAIAIVGGVAFFAGLFMVLMK